MEENKQYSELPEEKDPMGASDAMEDMTEANGEGLSAEEAAFEEAFAKEAPAAPEWTFGGEADVSARALNKRGTRIFVSIFAGVLAVCILLVGVTLFLGDGAIRFIRTLHTDRTVYVREYTGEGGLLSAQEAADLVKKSTVTVVIRGATGGLGHGSGFLYREENGMTYICTNNHVVEEGTEIQVILDDGSVFDAALVGRNSDADVAVIKIAATGLPLVSLGSSADLLAGDDVFAVGTPAKIDYAGTVTFGKISHPSRLLPMTDASGSVSYKMTLIQTDVALNNGNSGGPLADLYGKVVGMSVMKLDSYGGNDMDAMNFALPIDGVRIIADTIIQKGFFDGVNPISEGASALGLTGHGVMAGYWYTTDPATNKVDYSKVEVEGYYYAEKSGVYVSVIGAGLAGDKLFVGDIILKVNGFSVRNVNELIGAVNRHYIGESVTLTVWHAGAEITVDVTLVEKPVS